MAGDIKFSVEYLTIMNKYMKIIRKMKNNKHVMFFKPKHDTSTVMISKMCHDVLVHIATGFDNAAFEGTELGIENLDELLKYINIAGYPEEDNTKISYNEVKTNFGATIPSIILSGYDGQYHLPLGRPTLYDKDYDWLVPTAPENDPTTVVAECKLNAQDFSRLYDHIKLLSKPNIFGVHIENGELNIYIKGPINQQYRKQLDPTKTKVYNNFTTKLDGVDTEFRLFSTKFIENLVEFGCDFDLVFRYHAESDSLLVKAFATVLIAGCSPISILIGTHESDSDASEGKFEVLF